MPKKIRVKKLILKSKKISKKPFTLNDLVKYNRDVLFPVLDNKFAKIDDKFAKIDDKFAKIDDKFAKIDDKFAKIGDKFSKIDERFDNIENEIKEKFDKVLTGQDKIMKTLEDIKSDNIASLGAQKRQEEKLENHEARIKIIEHKTGIIAMK